MQPTVSLEPALCNVIPNEQRKLLLSLSLCKEEKSLRFYQNKENQVGRLGYVPNSASLAMQSECNSQLRRSPLNRPRNYFSGNSSDDLMNFQTALVCKTLCDDPTSKPKFSLERSYLPLSQSSFSLGIIVF